MLARRIIPCLDVQAGRVVKGVHFVGLRDAGDPVERATLYERQGADEIVFLDISASIEGRDTLVELVERTSQSLFVPFTVGGGIRTVEDIGHVLRAGADKVSINTAALQDPSLITRSAEAFGSQCVVVAIDAKRTGDRSIDTARTGTGHTGDSWEVYSHGGRYPTGRDGLDWAQEAVALGAGELLVTSIDRDGTQAGYDVALLRALVERIPVPVIASGGAGDPEDIRRALQEGGADAALAASIFHDGIYTVQEVKAHLRSHGVPVR